MDGQNPLFSQMQAAEAVTEYRETPVLTGPFYKRYQSSKSNRGGKSIKDRTVNSKQKTVKTKITKNKRRKKRTTF